eukprot:scaffold1396_cov252-Pinguiococcus_pyrenoidosus.AAC.29
MDIRSTTDIFRAWPQIGYVQKGSKMSLAMGAGSGLVVAFCAYMYAVEYYQTPNISKVSTVIPLFISGAISVLMTSRYASSGKFMPAGVVACLSVLTCTYYALRLSGVLKRPKRRRARYNN